MNKNKLLNKKKISNKNLHYFVKNFFDIQGELKCKRERDDFMNLLAHEIKTPLAVTMFYIDALIDDFEDKKLTNAELKDKLENTEKQLEKISVLVNNIFQSQKNDIWHIILHREKTDLWEWLCQELKCFQNRFKDIEFITDISEKIKNYSFDKLLMSQVISNIIWNAIKFSRNEDKQIFIQSFSDEDYIYIDIKDNWKWFADLNKDTLLDKYNVWVDNEWWMWMWMWLYISNVIIKKHWWQIELLHSDTLKWAKVRIKLRKIKNILI